MRSCPTRGGLQVSLRDDHPAGLRSEEHTSELQSQSNLVCRLLLEKKNKMGKVMRHTLGASLNIRHNLSSSKGPKPLQLKLLTTYIPKTSAFTLAFSTSQRLRTTRASARTFFTFRHYITPSARFFFKTFAPPPVLPSFPPARSPK